MICIAVNHFSNMTSDLCRDVERLILDKANSANDMLFAVYEENDHMKVKSVLFVVTRNMLDPE